MRILKKILIALVAVVVLLQVPFIYRRWQMGKTADKIVQSGALRSATAETRFNEYKGIIHAHTSLGGHSSGAFEELIAAANANDLDFVLMTEHYSEQIDTAALTLNGPYGKTLFVGGNEIDTADGDRLLMIPGSAEAPALRHLPTNAVIEKLHSEGRLALVTYPDRFKTWDSAFDGTEVFSVHTAAKSANPFTAAFDLIWSFPSYPELTLASYFRRPDTELRRFDELTATRKLSLFAGTDAHSNIGLRLFADDAGNSLFSIQLDPYRTILGIVRAHVLLDKNVPFSRESLLEAIKNGQFYVGFDAIGDTTGFTFSAENDSTSATMGGEILAGSETRLRAAFPMAVRFVFYRNGQQLPAAESASEASLDLAEPGVYRVEVYRDDLGSPYNLMPWIISNPIYVR